MTTTGNNMNDALQLALPYPTELDELEPNETGDINENEQLGLRAIKSREDILTALGNWYRATEAKLDGIKATYKPLIEAMQADERHLENKLKFIELCITRNLSPQKGAEFVNESVKLSYRESQRVVIDKEEDVPLDLCRTKVEPALSQIREKLIAGEQVPGARLEKSLSLQVAAGGVRAIENAKRRMKQKEVEQ